MKIAKSTFKPTEPKVCLSTASRELKELVQKEPDLNQDIQDYIDLSPSAARKKISQRHDKALIEHFSVQARIGLRMAMIGTVSGALLGVEPLLAVLGADPRKVPMGSFYSLANMAVSSVGLVGMVAMQALGVGGNALSLAEGLSTAFGRKCSERGGGECKPETDLFWGDPKGNPEIRQYIRDSVAANCITNSELMNDLKSEDSWRLPQAEDSKAEVQNSPQQVSSLGRIYRAGKGVLNTARTFPKWATLPLLNAVLSPTSGAQELRNERLCLLAATAAVGFTLTGGFLPAMTTWALAGGFLNIGRETKNEVQEDGKGNFLSEIATGYRNAIIHTYQEGKTL